MRQAELLVLSMSLKEGQAVNISEEDIREAVRGGMSSIFDSVRDSDIKDFIETISNNWSVEMRHDRINKQWTMFKKTVTH